MDECLQELIQEHRELESLLHTFLESPEQVHGTSIRQMCQKLQLHMKVEEELILPAAKEYLNACEEIEMIEDSLKEHTELKDFIIKFLAETIEQQEMQSLLRDLLHDLEHHHKDEETKLFPVMHQRLLPEQFQVLNQKNEKFRSERRGQFQAA